MKGFLKCSESVFVLRPKVTTIGRHGDSDLVLKSADIEEHHACIELNELENCFVLHDLNSLHGTFVNDCHIQNAAVKLSPGDNLRFGCSGSSYELLFDNTPQMFCPPVKRRTAWPGELQLLCETRLHSPPLSTSQLPFLQSQSSPILGNWIHGGNGTVPHPPNRSRSASAGGRKTSFNFSADAAKKSPAIRQGNNLLLGNGASPSLDSLLQEKDNEAYRFLALECESKCKDALIATLRERVGALTQQISQAGSSRSDMDITEKLLALEQEITEKTEEIQNLKEQIDSVQKGSSQVLCHSLSVRDCQISNLKNESDKLRKNLSVTSGLVTTLQREASTKEQQIIQIKLEADTIKRENREKESQLAAMSVKLSRIREEKREDGEIKKDLLVYKNCIKEMELKVKELEAEVQNCHQEQKRLQNVIAEKNKFEEKLNQEHEKKSLQLQEMGRRERLIKSQMEAFRTQIIHIIFSPEETEDEISVQQITEKLRRFLLERMQFQEKVKVLKDRSKQETLKKALEECQASLKMSCSIDDLNREISYIHNLRVDSSVFWIRGAVVQILKSVMSQKQEEEHLLQDLGTETSSLKEIPLYIKSLQEDLEQSRANVETLEMQLEEIQEHQTSLIQEKLNELEANLEKEFQDKMQQFSIAKQEENKKLLDDAIDLEKRKMAEAIEKENKKLEELECVMQQNIEAKIKEIETLNSHLTEALKSVEESKDQEAVLNEQLSMQDKQHEAEIHMVQDKFEKERQELVEYKEQIKQHSQTILALENRILEVTEEQRSLEKEKSILQENLNTAQKVTEQTNPATLTFPSEIYAIKETSTLLKKELADAQEEVIGQQDIIMCLKRELVEMNVRMSDMAGELREKEKMELEKKETIVRNQKAELSVLREKLADVSIRVEQKNIELERTNENLRQALQDVKKYQIIITENNNHLEKQQQELECLQNNNSQQIENFKKEETGVLHLAEQGAICRGLRHEETILKQKDAVVELRLKLKELEKAQPKIQEQASSPLRIMKKEILEAKTQKLLLSKEHRLSSEPSGMETKMSETYKSSEKSALAVERTARLEMSEALDLSEEMYFSLINVLGGLMSIKELSGLQSIKHLSQEEREKACKQRQKDIQLLSNRISQLKNQLKRKEELLTEYDSDLQELRQSKLALKMKQLDMTELESEIHRHAEENALLQEALNRTEIQLNQEKRMNRLTKQQKDLLEQPEKSESPAPSNEPEDKLGKGEPSVLRCCQDLKHGVPRKRHWTADIRRKKRQERYRAENKSKTTGRGCNQAKGFTRKAQEERI